MTMKELAEKVYKDHSDDLFTKARQLYPKYNTDLDGDTELATRYIVNRLEEFIPDGLPDDDYDELVGILDDMVFNGLT